MKLLTGLVVLAIIINLFTLHRLCGLQNIMRYEFGEWDRKIKQRIDGFLDVFRRNKTINNEQNP